MTTLTTLPRDADAEISALIEALHVAGQRLEELTGGEVDTVADRDGRTFLLRRAQEHLRQSEAAKQAGILNALPAHIALLDAEGVIVSVNDTWRRFGPSNAPQDPGHPIGVNYLRLCESAGGQNASEAHRIAEGARSVLRGMRDGFSAEYACPPPKEQWFRLTVTPLTDDRAAGAIVMHVDVTAERQAAASLRNSELRFRQMADNIRDVFFLQNPDSSQIFYVSPAYERIWGRTCESLYANPASWADAIHPDDLAQSFAKFKAGRTTGYDYEFRIIRPDGETRWIHVRGFPILDHAGNVYRTAGICSDITDRKHATDALRESEKRFSDVLGNVELISMMVDADANITYCNDFLLRLTGWQREEVIGRSTFDIFIPPDITDEMRGQFAGLIADMPSAWHHENEILTRSGARRLVQWNNIVVRSAAGEVVGCASIGDDITERKDAENRMAKIVEELNRSNQELEQFAYIASHDLQEPLRMVASYTQLLSKRYKGKLDSDADDFIAFAVDGASRMQRLIQDLLLYSRVGTKGKDLLDTSSEDALQKALANLHRAIEESNAVVTHDPLPEVHADDVQLIQLFQNLVGNAIKYHGTGVPQVHVSAVKNGADRWIFSVRDTGLGIESKYFGKIFGMFQRLHKREEFAGTGIGLAICKKIVERHGGKLTVASELGHGSTFSFDLSGSGGGA